MGDDVIEILKPFVDLANELDIIDRHVKHIGASDDVVVVSSCRGIGEPYVYVTRGHLRRAKEYYDKYK